MMVKAGFDGDISYHCDVCGAWSENDDVIVFENGEDICTDCLDAGKAPDLIEKLLALSGIPAGTVVEVTSYVDLGGVPGDDRIDIYWEKVPGVEIHSEIKLMNLKGLK